MNEKLKSLLKFKNLSIQFEDKAILSGVSGAVKSGERIGLVGNNGSGKTTLLRILTGELQQDSGEINATVTVATVPQLDLGLYKTEQPVYEYLAEKLDDWWSVLTNYTMIFGGELSELQQLKDLSGGELVKLHIALAYSHNPGILILDEPTNHLDLDSLERLQDFLLSSELTLLVVSHNIRFLNIVCNMTWELAEGQLTTYGGNYNFYQEQKAFAANARERELQAVQHHLKRAQGNLQQEQIKFQASQAKLKRAARSNDRSLPKIVRNAMKGAGQVQHGINKRNLSGDIAKLAEKAAALKAPKRKPLHLSLSERRGKGLVFKLQLSKLALPNGRILLEDVDLAVYRGDRIALLGANGSGKSTLLQQFPSGTFIDQKYNLVRGELSLLANLQEYTGGISYELAREVLSQLGFHSDLQVQQKAATLSGGETARLCFALAISANPDLLVLDEPTNNLDVATVAVILDALNQFGGGLVVVSHDLNFLAQLRIDRYFKIVERELQIWDKQEMGQER